MHKYLRNSVAQTLTQSLEKDFHQKMFETILEKQLRRNFMCIQYIEESDVK
jgi:hypothetical protein